MQKKYRVIPETGLIFNDTDSVGANSTRRSFYPAEPESRWKTLVSPHNNPYSSQVSTTNSGNNASSLHMVEVCICDNTGRNIYASTIHPIDPDGSGMTTINMYAHYYNGTNDITAACLITLNSITR